MSREVIHSFALGILSFLLSHMILTMLHFPSLIALLIAAAIVEESLKISSAMMADVPRWDSLYLVALGFSLAESVYYFSLFGSIVIWNRVVSTISHLVFACIYLRFHGSGGFAAASLTHVAYNAYWLL